MFMFINSKTIPTTTHGLLKYDVGFWDANKQRRRNIYRQYSQKCQRILNCMGNTGWYDTTTPNTTNREPRNNSWAGCTVFNFQVGCYQFPISLLNNLHMGKIDRLQAAQHSKTCPSFIDCLYLQNCLSVLGIFVPKNLWCYHLLNDLQIYLLLHWLD